MSVRTNTSSRSTVPVSQRRPAFLGLCERSRLQTHPGHEEPL